MCLFGNNNVFLDFDLLILLKMFCSKVMEKKTTFCAVLALSALWPLVVCSKDPIYKKGVDTSLHTSTSWG